MDDDYGDKDRQRIVDRANRMLEQSRVLRKMSDELHQESRDLRESAARMRPKRGARKKAR